MINLEDEDEQMVDQEHLEADVGNHLALVAMEAKAGCKNAPIVVEQYEFSVQFEQNAQRSHRRLARHLQRLQTPSS